MASIIDMKNQQTEEETETFVNLAHAKFEAVYLELDLMRRAVRLTESDSAQLLLGAIFRFATENAVTAGNTREEFLSAIASDFDDVMSEAEEDEEPTDKEPHEGLQLSRLSVVSPVVVE